MRLITYYLLLITYGLWLVACGNEEKPSPSNESTMIDATGEAIALLPLPSKIVSFAPSITQAIYSLGEQGKLIGVTRYCKLPAGETKQRIGNLLTQDIEQIILLHPDLVLATKEGNQPEFASKLRKLGVHVFVLPEANSRADIQSAFQQTGRLLG